MKTKPKKQCPSCKKGFTTASARFCPFCGYNLLSHKEETVPLSKEKSSPGLYHSESSASLIPEHLPKKEDIRFAIGQYQVISEVGKGGMGEVFLAYDPYCGRKIALKRIRPDLIKHKQMHRRFIKEARVTSQLTHPAIIPIYNIQKENENIYYTMPYVEGETLKQILRTTRKQQKEGLPLHHVGGSIPALIRIFISVCQAVAYAHSKGVLHRDLKPENIIVGRYGEVMILDWGLAKLTHHTKKEIHEEGDEDSKNEEIHPLTELTRVGKVVGTVSHMAPERAIGQPANTLTDIYSLGAILYQILTLNLPFKRGSLKEFREQTSEEELSDPSEIAPYRDVPRLLTRISAKCLSPSIETRYQNVNDMIRDLENYIEGRSEWFEITHLDIHNKDDWEFQENVLIAEHIAITRGTEVADWVSLMISKASFTQNTKIEANVRFGDSCSGIGFLISIPEAAERYHLNDGYCLWIGSETNRSTKLLRSTVEVMQSPDTFLRTGETYRIRIEKIDTNLHFYINDLLQFSYISHLPLAGTHIGLLSRDADFTINEWAISVAGQNIMVNCLAVPDTFLAHKNYQIALNEYRRIGYSFPGRAEGRDAMFRSGITLLEQARNSKAAKKRNNLFDAALDEFEKLHGTPGAPLEYLGKSLVYRSQHDFGEEIKCFEMACRRYPKHPLLHVIHEQIIYRMHEISREHRGATYQFILLVVRRLPDFAASYNSIKLFTSLQKHWEPLDFILEDPNCETSDWLLNQLFAIKLTFWLGKPYILAEIIDDLMSNEPFSPTLIFDALYSMIELGSWNLALKKLDEVSEGIQDANREKLQRGSELIRIALFCYQTSLEGAMKTFNNITTNELNLEEERILLFMIQMALDERKPKLIHELVSRYGDLTLSEEGKLSLDCYEIWAYMLEKEWGKAESALHRYPLANLSQETSLLHFLYGCWLHVTEGKEIADIHFSGLLDVVYPRSWNIFSHFYTGKIHPKSEWFKKAFVWEKRQLYRQLSLFYYCTGDSAKARRYRKLQEKQYIELI